MELVHAVVVSSISRNEQPQLKLCFTNNLYVWQQQQQLQLDSDNNNNNNTFMLEDLCVSLQLQRLESLRLPEVFQPQRYGAAMLVADNNNNNNNNNSGSTSSSLLAVCIYKAKHQKSRHLSYRSVLQSTTDHYNITGRVVVAGVVSLLPNTLVAQDEQVLFFSYVRITMVGPPPPPPRLFLYLSNRTNEWQQQVNESQDLFVSMGGDGSFSQRGRFQRQWPHPTVNIADYAAKGGGYWLLWCSNCNLTLAIAPLVPLA